jgi:hypothetical protein
MERRLEDLIEGADLNGLLRAVDGLCSARAWDDLVELADRCEQAVERGKQLWPIAAHIDHRLALEAPGPYAGEVVGSDLGRFALGPLTEVAASTHEWADLVPYIEADTDAAYVAQERVLRGENLEREQRAHPQLLNLPLALQPWEPTYSLATYRADVVEVAEPWTPRAPMETVDPEPATPHSDPELEDTLIEVVQPWVSESSGAARAVIVEGDAVGAVSNLTFERVHIGVLDPAEAIQRVAWAAASGGAHGRRRGAAFGRFMAFYLIGVLGDLGWPAAPDAIGATAARFKWYVWDEDATEEGWVFRLAVEDPNDGWAAAIGATDLLDDADTGER